MIKTAFDQYAAQSNKSWLLSRSHTVGASSVWQCARKVWFEKNADDLESPQADTGYVDSWGAKLRGTIMEDELFVPALKLAYGDDFIWGGTGQQTFVLDHLSATPDGMLINRSRDALAHLGIADIEGACVVTEAKTVDPRISPDSLPKPEHVSQAVVQLGMIRRFTPYRPMYAVIAYTDASWWDQVREFPVRFDPQVFQVARARARDIMLAHAANDLKPEGAIAGGKDCRYCPFTQACGQARAAYVPRQEKVLAPAEVAPIAAQAKLARSLKAESEQKAGAAREAEAKLRDMLAQAGTRKIEIDEVKVSWRATRGRASVDNVQLREAAIKAGIDVSQFNKIGAPSDTLVISASKIP